MNRTTIVWGNMKRLRNIRINRKKYWTHEENRDFHQKEPEYRLNLNLRHNFPFFSVPKSTYLSTINKHCNLIGIWMNDIPIQQGQLLIIFPQSRHFNVYPIIMQKEKTSLNYSYWTTVTAPFGNSSILQFPANGFTSLQLSSGHNGANRLSFHFHAKIGRRDRR